MHVTVERSGRSPWWDPAAPARRWRCARRARVDAGRGGRAARLTPRRRRRPRRASVRAAVDRGRGGARRRPRDRRDARRRDRRRPPPHWRRHSRAGALVVHLSGACPLEELDKLHAARPDVEVGSLHPLQSLPSPELGVARLPGSWCAVDGPPSVERLAVSLGLRPFRVPADRRARYHAAATIASNHLVALLGQAARVADAAGVPPEALLPLVPRDDRQRRRAGRGGRTHRTRGAGRRRHRRPSPRRALARRARGVPRARARSAPTHRPRRRARSTTLLTEDPR